MGLALLAEARAAPLPSAGAGRDRPVVLASLYRAPEAAEVARPPDARTAERPGFWDGVPDEVLLERIRTQEIVKVGFNRGGSSLSLRLVLADGSVAAFKPDQIHDQTVPRKEIAAYRLARLLGLARVPPATCRVVPIRTLIERLVPEDRHLAFRIRKESRPGRDGTVAGEISWWVPELAYWPIDRWQVRQQFLRWLKAYHDLPAARADRAGQFSTMVSFDYLINNPDRFSGNNTLGSPDGRFLYFMDNTWSFYPIPPRGGWGARSTFDQVQRFSRRLARRLRALTEARVREAFAAERHAVWPLLTEPELQALLARRAYALEHVTGVVARFGWERTMVFP
jgi:hypothetical protein